MATRRKPLLFCPHKKTRMLRKISGTSYFIRMCLTCERKMVGALNAFAIEWKRKHAEEGKPHGEVLVG